MYRVFQQNLTTNKYLPAKCHGISFYSMFAQNCQQNCPIFGLLLIQLLVNELENSQNCHPSGSEWSFQTQLRSFSLRSTSKEWSKQHPAQKSSLWSMLKDNYCGISYQSQYRKFSEKGSWKLEKRIFVSENIITQICREKVRNFSTKLHGADTL